ncbi:uncharacterized protein LOC136034589 isoform X2 [Artemia franciscana]|uniref:uncharacterized protein LOC136034589 isoform X2 n=1 Tax=Artemia franciscana TaxID=6661 RepID=UPI0032DBA106
MKEKPENLEFVKAFVKEMKQSMTVFKKRGISAFPSALPPKSPVSEPFIFSCAREEASSTSSKKRYVRGMIREIYIREIYSRLQQTISTSIAPTIDIDRFKKLIEDIIEFFISVEHAVAESAEFGSCSSKRSCKPKKKEYCDGKETGHSIAKLEEDFIDTLRKFKLSFNLLAELKAQIIDSFSTDVIDFLFTYLELIIDASRDAELETNIPKRIVLPPLTVKAAKLLSNCLTSKQAEFWKSLGKAWQAPSWYFGRLSNQDVIDVLRSIGQDGAFLVRDSRSVSFGYVLCVRKENRVFQYRINKVHGYEIGGLTFSDLPAVISYYKKTQSLDTKLRKPPFDFDGLRRTEKNVAKSDLISSTSGEGIKDLTKALKDKFKGKFKNKSKKNKRKNYFQKHQKLGYLPVQLENYSANQNTAGDSTTSLQFTPSMSNLETPQSTRVGEDVHARQELYASRLAQLIAAIDQIHKEELESMIRKLEEETASLQAEYEILRGHQSPSLSLSSTSDANQSLNRIVLTTYIEREMLAEAQILRQPKARLEARMNILKEDNKQLRAQLARLRKPLDKDSEYVLLQERETSYFQDSEYVLLQERETECIQFEENFDGFLSRRFDKREGTEITDTIESMHLNNYALVHDGLNLHPRGLLNKGNYCYINAVLQGLMGCPPFYNMIRAIEPIVKMKDTSAKPTPVMETLVSFVNEFVTLPPPISPNPKAKESMKPSTKISHGLPFEPSMVYSLMQTFNAFKEIGRQEDAEELLTVLLNALNDEMIELVKPVSKLVQNSIDKPIENGNVEEPEEWHVIGPTNKGTLTRLATICRTPVGDLFLGQMRSVLRTEKGMCTATLQPFLTLQLDIQNEKVNTVNEALDMLVVKEPLVGYIDPKSKKEIRASRQTTLEALPPILMLHLKYFLYDKHGGCQKLMKRIDFPLELEITRDVLSSNIKAKMSNKQRNYKLFAAIYHDGKEATKGHYMADVYHPGLQRWIRYDDAAIKMVDEKTLLRHSPPRVPYLLFYKTKEF